MTNIKCCDIISAKNQAGGQHEFTKITTLPDDLIHDLLHL